MANLPVPIPRTFTPAEIEVATYFNANVRDGLNFVIAQPVAILTQATLQSIATGAGPWAITFDSTVQDFYGGHSNSTNNSRYVAQIAGTYLAVGNPSFQANGNGQRSTWIAKNGSVITYSLSSASPSGSGTATAQTAFCLVPMIVGDYVETYVSQTAGVSLNTVAANCAMHIYWMHS